MKWNIPFFNKSEIKTQPTITDIDLSSNETAVQQILLGVSGETEINIQPKDAYIQAEKNADLGNAILKIAQNIASMILVVIDSEGEIIYDDPVLDIFNHPGEMRNKSKVLLELSMSYLLTNEGWIVARGNVNNPPLAIVPIRPYNISVILNYSDGMPDVIQTQSEFDRKEYHRNEIDGEFKFYDKAGLNEIIPIIGMSNLVDGWRGQSPLNKLFYDISMGTSGKRHNKSLLDNGLRTSAVISPTSALGSSGMPRQWGEKIVSTLQKTFRTFHQGSGNAGNVIISGEPLEVTGLAQNNTDMDFAQLLTVSRESIYNLYQIPLPLILSNAMTLNNYTVALRTFYIDAVFPVFDYILGNLSDALRNRYPSLQNGEMIGFSEIDIRGMRPILVENMRMLNDTEAVTTNEIRSTGGFENDPGGDVILVSANKVSLDSVTGGGSFATAQPNVDGILNENTDQQDQQSQQEETSTIVE
jgi:HK97 family phage portal protein